MSSSTLTPRQRAVLDCITTTIETRGYPPSLREIGDAVGLTSVSSVARQITALADLGHIRRDGSRARALTIVKPDTGYITVPRPTVPFGPKGVPVDVADADYLRSAAGNIEFSRCLGSNLTATVVKLLNDAADALNLPGPGRS